MVKIDYFSKKNHIKHLENTILYFSLFLLICLFVFTVVELELRALHLLGKCSTTWATASASIHNVLFVVLYEDLYLYYKI
jgi:hypothetical protein